VSTGVEVVAIVTPAVVAFGVAAFTIWSQALQTHENRVGDKQADAYLMLAEHVVRLRQYAYIAFPQVPENSPLMPPWLSEEDRYRMYAQIEAWGSGDMRLCLDKLLTAHARTRTLVSHLVEIQSIRPPYTSGDLQERSQAVDAASEARSELQALCEEALKRINTELQATRTTRSIGARLRWPWKHGPKAQ